MAGTGFSADEFRARRGKLCGAIGTGAVAIVPGAKGPKGSQCFRQYNDFHYLCGVETPESYLMVHGADETADLFLPHASQVERQTSAEPLSAETGERVCELSGVDRTFGLEQLGDRLGRVSVVYVPFEDGQGRGVNRHHCQSWARKVGSNPWDVRLTRADHFIQTIRSRFPHIEIRNLSPIMDELRLVKSPAEIDLLRRAGLLTAVGTREAIRSTCPGVMEYQLDSVMRYHFLAGGAADRAYHAIVAGGPNAWYGHYSRNDCRLCDGDMVLVDCAPDFHYYASDIGRMWPVNGTYSQWQREVYGFVVEYHKVLLAGIRPGRMLEDIRLEAAETMAGVLSHWTFSSTSHQAGARTMLDFRGHLSHCVGMSVHDGGLHYTRPLEVGIVFSVDPQLRVPDEELYVRVEDTIVVTEDGIENLTRQAPLELDDVESLMREDGLLQTFPPA